MEQRTSMLDLVRRTCDDARGLDDFEGVYEPDPEQVAAAHEAMGRPEYNGEMRYVNCGPEKVKNLLATETDPVELEAIEYAYEYWRKAGGYSGQMEAGYVDRGDAREAIVAESMSELVSAVKPVAAVTVMGSLSVGGISTQSGPVEPGEYRDTGIIDWGDLLSQGPLPETEDWF